MSILIKFDTLFSYIVENPKVLTYIFIRLKKHFIGVNVKRDLFEDEE